jgi:hypothetical protein
LLQETYGSGRHKDSEHGNQNKQKKGPAAGRRQGQKQPCGDDEGFEVQMTGDNGKTQGGAAAAAGGGRGSGGGGGVNEEKREVPRLAMMHQVLSQESEGTVPYQEREEQQEEQGEEQQEKQQQGEEREQQQADVGDKEAEMVLDELYGE